MLGVEEAKDLDACGHESRPACLVAGPQSGAVITMKVLIEEEVVAPLGVGLDTTWKVSCNLLNLRKQFTEGFFRAIFVSP
jgi:hypothetical protein